MTGEDLKRAFTAALTKAGWTVDDHHNAREDNRGIPDLWALAPWGCEVWIEFKSAKEQLRPEQRQVLDRLHTLQERAGGAVLVLLVRPQSAREVARQLSLWHLDSSLALTGLPEHPPESPESPQEPTGAGAGPQRPKPRKENLTAPQDPMAERAILWRKLTAMGLEDHAAEAWSLAGLPGLRGLLRDAEASNHAKAARA